MTWRASATHLYPGARLTVDSLGPARAGPLTIEFADLGAAPARLQGRAGAWRLEVAPHHTQRGTAIAAKAWRVEPLPTPDGAVVWRVLRRAN